MSIMDGHKQQKLNFLLNNLPPGCVVVQSWLSKNDIYRQLVEVYCKSGWLQKIGHGAYVRPGDAIFWTGGIYAIQKQLELPIHVGGSTALQRQGLAHFLPLGGGGSIFLLGQPPVKLPRWFREYDWNVKIHYSALQLFNPAMEAGLTQENIGQYTITLSSPERAIMEVLHFIPKEESLENAKYLMEGLTTLRPNFIQKLLEKCRSVEVKRLFLFLAEECKHDWVNDLDISRIDLGKGKRVIFQQGRLDPIYSITVPNKPFVDSRRQMQNLQNRRKKSPAVRLMCPEQGTQLTYGKEHGCFGSMLYLAFESGYLPVLDHLLKEFKIEQRGSKDFQKRLKENWLPHVPGNNLNEINKRANNTFAALIELMVAQHLKENGAKIVNLEAWKQKNSRIKVPDIHYQNSIKNHWNAEIKYIDQSPEWQENVVTQLKTGKPKGRWFGDGEFINYYFGRIAEASKQLESHPYETRQVWLVFHARANFERTIFEENYLKKPPHWFENTEEQKKILEMFGTDIAKTTPSEWLKKVPQIILATFNSWSLEKIKRYKTKDLIT